MLRCSNELRHVVLDVLTAPWRKNDIFGFFGVRHANQGQKKYGINSCPFFIWYLECNERCRLKNMISNFVAPWICVRRLFMDRDRTLLTWTDLLQLLLKYFLGMSLHSGREERRGFLFFFFFGVWSGQCWPGQLFTAALIGPLGLPGGLRRCVRQPRAYKSPFGSFQSSFLTFSPLLTSTKISRVILSSAGPFVQP